MLYATVKNLYIILDLRRILHKKLHISCVP